MTMTFFNKNKAELSGKEAQAYDEIRAFKKPDVGIKQWATEAVSGRLKSLAEYLEDSPPGDAIDTASAALLEIINDVSIWSVRESKIWEEFQDANLDVAGIEDIEKLSLEAIEEVLGRLSLKYRVAALVQGMSVGSFGLVGVLAGLPSIIAMSLRAIAEYATYYGFDVTSKSERPYVLMILAVAAASGEARQDLLKQVEDYGVSVEDGGEKRAAMPSTSEVVDHLAVRLVRGKMSQTIPLAGALIGASFNQAFVKHVCESAQQLLRERWLIRRYHEPSA